MGRPAYDTSKARVREEHGKPVGNEDGRRRTSATSSVWGEAHQEAPLKPDLRRRRWSRAATPAAVPLRQRSVASSRLQAPRSSSPAVAGKNSNSACASRARMFCCCVRLPAFDHANRGSKRAACLPKVATERVLEESSFVLGERIHGRKLFNPNGV